MALTWDVSKVKDYKTVTTLTVKNKELPKHEWRSDDPEEEAELWHPDTERCIWECLSTDMPGIREKDFDEFWFRSRLLMAIGASSMMRGNKPLAPEEHLEVLQRHIGLETNVSKKTRAQFLKRQLGHFERDVKGVMKYAQKKLDEKAEGEPESSEG